MDQASLQTFLPAIMLVFIAIIVFWESVRRNKRVKIVQIASVRLSQIKTVDTAFKVMMVVSMAIVVIYSYFPEYYYWTMPIDPLDRPVINTIGVLILKIAMAWIVLAQLNIDRAIFLINSGLDEWSYKRMFVYSRKLVLSGMLVMFLGLFVTISSVGTILICISGLALFNKVLRPV
jgi:hypothetical protein